MLSKYILAIIASILIAAFIMFSGENLASIILGICLLAYIFFISLYNPKKLNNEIKQLNDWATRTLKYSIIWLPLFLVAFFLYQRFWSGNSMMIFIIGLGSVVIAILIGKLFFKIR